MTTNVMHCIHLCDRTGEGIGSKQRMISIYHRLNDWLLTKNGPYQWSDSNIHNRLVKWNEQVGFKLRLILFVYFVLKVLEKPCIFLQLHLSCMVKKTSLFKTSTKSVSASSKSTSLTSHGSREVTKRYVTQIICIQTNS